jgi:hypothetical protein
LHRGLGSGTLESGSINTGKGRSVIHDVMAAAVAPARISAITLA